MKTVLSIAISLATIAIAAIAIYYIANNAPKAERRQDAGQRQDSMQVSILELQPQNLRLPVIAYGTVEAGEQTKLATQVKGQVSYIAPSFSNGMEFKKEDVLLRQDKAQLVAIYNIAKAELETAEALYEEEQARARQALANWKLANNKNKPDPLVLREPQVAMARASVTKAKNRLQQTYLDLAASTIKAPYDGITLDRQVNIAQYLPAGSTLGTIMAKNYHKIRVALNGDQLERVAAGKGKDKLVLIAARIGTQSFDYSGYIAAAEAQVDTDSRQFHLIVHIDKPFNYVQPLYPGQYVQVSLPGREIKNVYSVPLSAIDKDDQVAIRRSGRLRRVTINLLTSEQGNAIVTGLTPGSELITSVHSGILEGTQVVSDEQEYQQDHKDKK